MRTDVKKQNFGDLQWDFIYVNEMYIVRKEKKFYFPVSSYTNLNIYI